MINNLLSGFFLLLFFFFLHWQLPQINIVLSRFRMQFPVSNWPASQTYCCGQRHEAVLHTSIFTNTSVQPTEKPLYYLQKQRHHHLELFPSSVPHQCFESILSEDASCVSQFDKALVLVDISHRISTSQLEEPVHSVICQQVLRLCQMQ